MPTPDITAGQGMLTDGKNKFQARDCLENTYGVSGTIYGLTSSPCKPCPRNMITGMCVCTGVHGAVVVCLP